MKHAQIGKILKVCRQNHVKKIKIEELEIEFYDARDTEQPIIQGVGKNTEATSSATPTLKPVTEDEMLFWSTPFYDELREDRKKGQSA